MYAKSQKANQVVLALKEYNINWKYVTGKKNTVADRLLRINVKENRFVGENLEIWKVYHLLKDRSDLEKFIQGIEWQ